MRFMDMRAGWSVNGDYVAMIPAGHYLTNQEMYTFYHLRPSDERYPALVKPSQFARVVLRKHNGNLVVAPINKDVEEMT